MCELGGGGGNVILDRVEQDGLTRKLSEYTMWASWAQVFQAGGKADAA